MNILFLCVGNSARSQIAEGLAREMLPNSFDIRSAGSSPAEKIHEDAISVMADIGIDISNGKPKSIDSLDKEFMDDLNYVITLCAEEVCPVVLNATNRLNWALEDPVKNLSNNAYITSGFTKTREDIYNLLKKFIIHEF